MHERWLGVCGVVCVQVSDFGLSRVALSEGSGGGEASAGPAGDEWGTPAYSAPEVLEGRPSKASDVWSYGCLLYHMVTGAPPHADLSTFQVRPGPGTGWEGMGALSMHACMDGSAWGGQATRTHSAVSCSTTRPCGKYTRCSDLFRPRMVAPGALDFVCFASVRVKWCLFMFQL